MLCLISGLRSVKSAVGVQKTSHKIVAVRGGCCGHMCNPNMSAGH